MTYIMEGKRWVKLMLSGSICVLVAVGSLVWLIDPYIHYHKPLKAFFYNLSDERYVNDGIAKHFEYEALITGSSMTQNFKTSEFKEIFGVEAVKLPFSGGSYREVNGIVQTALRKSGNQVQYVLRGLDYNGMMVSPETLRYEENTYPWYLYNDKILDDAEYLFNKKVLIGKLLPAITGYFQGQDGGITSFDVYSNWNGRYQFGKEELKKHYKRVNKKEKEQLFTKDDRERVIQNVKKNVTDIADEFPETEFYYFFTPYSFWHWDNLILCGNFKRTLEAERVVIEEIFRHPNIKLFSFNTRFSMTCNLDNYKDIDHYGEWINSKMLYWMKSGDYQVTPENYEVYLKREEQFYQGFDFDAYFEHEALDISGY